METTEQYPDVVIDADPAVWLRGPAPDATDAVRGDWVKGAVYAVATDFDLENAKGGADYREYVHAVLSAFSRMRPDAAAATFLRFRHLGDRPAPVILELYTADEVAQISAHHEVDFAASMLEVGPVPTVGETSLEAVPDSGWERLVFWVASEDERPESRVRYARVFPSSGVLAALRFGGGDPAATVDLLADADDLVRSITVGGER